MDIVDRLKKYAGVHGNCCERELAAADEIERLRAEFLRLRDAMTRVVAQACYTVEGEVDSSAIGTYADAIRLLAELGVATLTYDKGRRVVAKLNQVGG